jgi:hypothetical protein
MLHKCEICSRCISRLLLALKGGCLPWRSEADLRTRTSLQLLEVLYRCRLIRKQVEARGRIFGKLNPAIGESVVEPMGGDPEPPGELGDRQKPGHMSRMRLMPLLHTTMLEPNSSDRAR